MNVGEIFVKLGLNADGYNRGVDQAQQKATGLSGFLKQGFAMAVGTKIFDGLIGGAKAAISASIGFNSQMENSQAAFTTLLGSAEKAKSMLGDLSKFAASTPFELGDLTKASQTLLGFGISAEKVKPYLSELGDVSMGDKDKLQGLTLAFAQVQSAGKMTGQDLMQMINNGFNPLQIMSQQTGKSMAQLKDEMSKGGISADMVAKAFEGATAKGGLFYGAMDKASKTFSGQMSTIADDVNSTIGALALPMFNALSQQVLPNVIKGLDEFAKGIKEGKGVVQSLYSALQTVFGSNIADMITAPIKSISAAFATVKAVITGDLSGLQDIYTKNLGIPSGTATTIISTVQNVRNGFSGFVDWIKSLLPSAGAIMQNVFQGMANVFGFLAITITNNKGAINGTLQQIGQVVGQVFSYLAQHGELVQKVVEVLVAKFLLTKSIGGVLPIFQGIAGSIINVATSFKGVIGTGTSVVKFFTEFGKVGSIGETIILKLMYAWDKIGPVLSTVGGFVMKAVNVFKMLWGVLMANPIVLIIAVVVGLIAIFVHLYQTNEGFRNKCNEIWNSIKNTAISIFSGIASFFVSIWNAIKQPVETTLNTIWTIIQTVFGLIGLWIKINLLAWQVVFSLVWSIISGIVSAAMSFIQNTIIPIFQAIGNFISQIMTFIWSIIQTVFLTIYTVIATYCQFWWTIISTVFTAIYTVISTILTTVWTFISARFMAIYTTISNILHTVFSIVSSIWHSISSTISSVASSIYSRVSSVFSSVYSTASSIFNNVKNTISNAFHTAYSTVSSVVNNIKSTVSSVFNGIVSTISGIVGKIQGFLKSMFKFDPPHIKTPHFSFTGKFGIDPPQVPHFGGVSWYAKGGIFTRASILGGGNVGVGEAGPEAVLPISKLGGMVAETLNKMNPTVALGGGVGNAVVINFHAPVYGLQDFEDKVEDIVNKRVVNQLKNTMLI